MDLDLQGSIERFTLPEIFQLIGAGCKSGTLGIQKDDAIVMIYFREGKIVYGYGPKQTFHLGQRLMDDGVISAAQLQQAVKMQSTTSNTRRLGEILMENASIDRADLEAVVKKQVAELVYTLVGWETGSFKFYEDQFPTEEEITVSLSVENVVMEGLRRFDESNMVKETFPDTKVVYVISAAQSGQEREIKLTADEWNLMALIDGHRTIDEVCDLGGKDRPRTLRGLARLKLSGLIVKTDRAEIASGKLDQMVNRLAGLFDDYLTEKRSSTQIRSGRITRSILERTD